MKATIQRTFPDGTRVNVESPFLHGLLDMNQLGRLLEGEAATTVLPEAYALPPHFGEKNFGEYIAIAIDEAPFGWGPFSKSVLVTRWPLEAQIFAGAILEPKEGGWISGACIFNDVSAKNAPAFLIREKWPTLLARLIDEELRGFLKICAANRGLVGAKIARELQSRCNFFNREGIEGFFKHPRNKNLWQIGANWDDWELRGLSAAERVGELNQFETGIHLGLATFLQVVKAVGLTIGTGPKQSRPKPRVRVPPPPEVELFTFFRNEAGDAERPLSDFATDEELETIFLGGSYPELGETASLSEREAALVRDWSPEEDAVFSYGGSPDLSFDLDPKIESSNAGEVGVVDLPKLLDRMWWWKSIVKDFKGATKGVFMEMSEKAALENTTVVQWPKQHLALFHDNWERSAFFYEFGARYKGRYTWGFGRPWVKLNNTERAILSIWWPVGHFGRNRIQPRLSPVVLQRMKSRVAVRLQHDLHAPGSVAKGRVLDEIMKLATKAGLKIPGKGKGRRKKLPWRALQYLDLEHFLGRKFPDSVTKLRGTTKVYEDACAAAGIEP